MDSSFCNAKLADSSCYVRWLCILLLNTFLTFHLVSNALCTFLHWEQLVVKFGNCRKAVVTRSLVS